MAPAQQHTILTVRVSAHRHSGKCFKSFLNTITGLQEEHGKSAFSFSDI
jgi:hypothetical protein